MNALRKTVCIFLCAVLAAGILAGCGNTGSREKPSEEEGKSIKVVATIFPIYDWTREILGARSADADLTLLLNQGVDLHSYQPTVEDMVKISTCDLFLYVGGESDRWVSDALANAGNTGMIAVSLLDVLGDAAREEETVEGMQEEEEDHEVEADAPEYDEHVWLSLRNAALFCGVIAEKLGELDPEGAEEYAGNAADYQKKLDELDSRYTAAVKEGRSGTLLFGDRFPFRYLTEDYGLDYYAAFSGCSAETEASFETVIFLAGKVDALGLPAVLTLENSDGRIARTIVENTESKNAEILRLDSLQSTTAQAIAAGTSYLGAMEENLETLRRALG